jgi:hypothetical protein
LSDPFVSYATGLDSPPSTFAAITPNDSTDITVCRAIYVGGSGDIKINGADGVAVTFIGVPAGWFPCRAVRVWSTGTTATNLIAGY